MPPEPYDLASLGGFLPLLPPIFPMEKPLNPAPGGATYGGPTQLQQLAQSNLNPVNWLPSVPEILLGVVAAGGILIGLWLMAGGPKPEVIPIPA